jgi:RHS repeat-associated protein
MKPTRAVKNRRTGGFLIATAAAFVTVLNPFWLLAGHPDSVPCSPSLSMWKVIQSGADCGNGSTEERQCTRLHRVATAQGECPITWLQYYSSVGMEGLGEMCYDDGPCVLDSTIGVTCNFSDEDGYTASTTVTCGESSALGECEKKGPSPGSTLTVPIDHQPRIFDLKVTAMASTIPDPCAWGSDAKVSVETGLLFPDTFYSLERGLYLHWLGFSGGNDYAGWVQFVEGTERVNDVRRRCGYDVLCAQVQACDWRFTDMMCVPVHDNDGQCTASGGSGSSAGGHIKTANGNMRHKDSEPLPGLAFPLRTFDSNDLQLKSFGRGWHSLFDARIQGSGAAKSAGMEEVAVKTEDARIFIFQDLGSGYVQTWPVGGLLGQLTYDAGAGVYLHRAAGASELRHFDAASGRLTKIEDLASGDAVEISFDANDLPVSVADAAGRWSWTVAANSTSRVVESITVDGLGATWIYHYAGGSEPELDRVEAPDGFTWRDYGYDGEHRLESVLDSQNEIIASFAYDSQGRALSAKSASGQWVDQVEYSPAGLDPRVEGEDVALVTWATGEQTVYYTRYIANRQRTVETQGSCDCGTGDAVYAHDPDTGNLLRLQDARGYITVRSYDSSGRVIQETRGMRPAGCDPAVDPALCRQDPDSLLTVALEASSATASVSTTYGDANWPGRATEVRSASVANPGEERIESFSYDPATGRTISHTVTGWTGTPPAQETRTTTTTLYNGSEGAVFSPGGAFDPAWETLPQPSGLTKLIDGPRTDQPEVSKFVYYPDSPSVLPATLRGRLAARRDPTGDIVRYESYDHFGNPSRVVDVAGVVTETTTDVFGRAQDTTLLAVPGCDVALDPLCETDLVRDTVYLPGGGPISMLTPPVGGPTVFGYGPYGRLESVSRGPSPSDLRERQLHSYDPSTGLKSIQTVERHDAPDWIETSSTRYEYDGAGRVERIYHPPYQPVPEDGAYEEYGYDGAGNVIRFQDANHDKPNVTYTYDPLGRLAKVEQLSDAVSAQWTTTQYFYDARGNLTSVIDGNGNQTTYEIDDFGQTTGIHSPVTGDTEMTYNPAGQLLTRLDARDALETRVYGRAGQLIRAVFTKPGENNETLRFFYDYGRRSGAKATDTNGVVVEESWAYNRLGAVSRYGRWFAGAPGASEELVAVFHYDGAGNLTDRIRGCEHLDYGLDYAGRPVSVELSPADCVSPAVTLASNISYLPYGPMTSISGGALEQSFDYDQRYRMISQTATASATTIVDRHYGDPTALDGYDGAGNLLMVDDLLAAARDRAYAYDDLGRLTDVGAPSSFSELHFSYDDVGNRLSKVIGAIGQQTVTTYEYDSATTLLESVTQAPPGSDPGVFILQYDVVGNLLNDGQSTYSYNLRNQLASHDDLAFRFDADGRRVCTMNNDNGRIAYHFLLPSGQPFYERVLTKSFALLEERSYVFLGNQLLAIVDGQGNAGQVVSDHIGLPLAVFNGGAGWQADLSPFGEMLQVLSGDAANDPLLRYPGQWALDTEHFSTNAELYYNGYRWYRPGWGRYTQVDPLAPGGSRNRSTHASRYRRWTGPAVDPTGIFAMPQKGFSYGNSNPSLWLDPLGLTSCIYYVSEHRLWCISDDGGSQFETNETWSGRGECRDNVACESIPDEGPIPDGYWDTGCIGCTPTHVVPRIPIDPSPGSDTETYGRGPFQIHIGPNPDASGGCIVMPPDVYYDFLDFYGQDDRGFMQKTQTGRLGDVP